MTRTRVTPEIARLFARDIREAGGPAPAHPERWSRTEVAAIETWVRGSDWYKEARRSGRGDGFLRLAFDVAQYFRNDHPTDAAGAPAPWPRAAFVPADGAADPFAGASPEAAAAYLIYAQAHPLYGDAMRDPKHEHHAALMEQTRALRRIAASAPDAPHPSDATAPVDPAAPLLPPGALSRSEAIGRLHSDEAYLNRRHPQHQEAVARMAALYAGGEPSAGTRTAAGAAGPPPASAEAPHATMDRIRKDAAYWDKHHPDHTARVDEMRQAHVAAFPSPQGTGGDNVA
jgi:hypothetical protein